MKLKLKKRKWNDRSYDHLSKNQRGINEGQALYRLSDSIGNDVTIELIGFKRDREHGIEILINL